MHCFSVLLFASAMLAACAPESPTYEPATTPTDDNRQLADLPGEGPTLTQEQFDTLWARAKATSGTALASIVPNPDTDTFWGRDLDDLEQWESFLVHIDPEANVDSVYVMVNIRSRWPEPPVLRLQGARIRQIGIFVLPNSMTEQAERGKTVGACTCKFAKKEQQSALSRKIISLQRLLAT